MDTQQIDKTLQRRRQMTETLNRAFAQSPQEMRKLLQVVGELYQSGDIPRFWDVLAHLAGADRGYGNGWFFTALELERQVKE